MAFKDSLDLRTAVCEAVGDSSITDVWPRIVALAEARLNRELRTRRQIATAHVEFIDGAGAVPDDYLELIDAGRGYIAVPSLPPVGGGSDYAAIYIEGAG